MCVADFKIIYQLVLNTIISVLLSKSYQLLI